MGKKEKYSKKELLNMAELPLRTHANNIGVKDVKSRDRKNITKAILRKQRKILFLTIPVTLATILGLVQHIIGLPNIYDDIMSRIRQTDESEMIFEPAGELIEVIEFHYDNDYGYIRFDGFNRRRDQLSISLIGNATGERDIIITGLTTRIHNIVHINEPVVFAAFSNNSRFDFDSNPIGGISIFVVNDGWAAAQNVMINMTDSSGILQNLINYYPFSLDIGYFDSGDYFGQIFLSNCMIINENIPEDGVYITLEGVITYTDHNRKQQERVITAIRFFLTSEGYIRPLDGMGGGFLSEFGIIFDANETEDVYFHRRTRAYLLQNSAIELPIRISTNRSVSFDLDVKVTINHSEPLIWARITGIELLVSSASGTSLQDGVLSYDWCYKWCDLMSPGIDYIIFFPFSHSEE